MTTIHVEFDWSDEFGPCYDCGLPAAYLAPDIYGPIRAISQANRFCSLCAAGHAADGEKIVWLFAEQYA